MHAEAPPGGWAPPVIRLELPAGVTGRPEAVLLDGGAQAYPRMLRAIGAARSTVRLQVYAFALDGIGQQFVTALGDAAGRGVAVQVLLDGWGSAWGGLAVAEALTAAGCQVRIYHRLLALLVGRLGRNHRKLLLVDDEVAFLGGLNVGDENLAEGARPGWADLSLELHGRACARIGRMLRGERPGAVDGAVQLWLSGPGGGRRLRRRYLRAFRGAERRILLAHGYFLPDAGLVRALTAAARRGVEVRLLLAGRSDVAFAGVATRSFYRPLLAAGVRIHEWDGSVLHAKVAAVDGRRLLVGSFNLDPFSLANMEALVEVADARVVEQAEGWIRGHCAASRSASAVEAGSWARRWLLDPAGRLLVRLAILGGRLLAGGRPRR